MSEVVVTGSFDNLNSRYVRFLHEASKLGRVCVLLWSDETVGICEGKAAKFPEVERLYLQDAIRFVNDVALVHARSREEVMVRVDEVGPKYWVVDEESDEPDKRAHCESRGVEYVVVRNETLRDFPQSDRRISSEPNSRKKVIVTGCFDWFHSGHVRFFEEVSELGDLYVVIGNDDNVQLLKGQGHPLFPQDERRYIVDSIRFVRQALIASGSGWLDAAPEIEKIEPDIYAVNQDGDRPQKREFCAAHGLEYMVLARKPREGLPRRESRVLRGF